MKLIELWNSVSVWKNVAVLKKDPKVAYQLFKYQRRLQKELDACDRVRESIIYQCAGVEPPVPPDVKIVALEPDSPQLAEFTAKFNEFLQTEVEVAPMAMTMDELIASLAAGNAISEEDIARLEPFFAKPEEVQA